MKNSITPHNSNEKPLTGHAEMVDSSVVLTCFVWKETFSSVKEFMSLECWIDGSLGQS